MEKGKFVCPQCGSESEAPGQCSGCQLERLATCTVCGNPIVGEHVHPES